jgi:hypothetical protein
VQVRVTGDSVQDRGNPQGLPTTAGLPSAPLAYNTVSYTTVNGILFPLVSSAGRTDPANRPTNYNPFQTTVDLRLQYRWSNNITLFTSIDNVANVPYGGTFRRGYRLGVRFNY